MRISDWNSVVCSSDLPRPRAELRHLDHHGAETRLPVVRFLALLVCRCRLSGRFRQLRPQRPALSQGPIRLRRPARAAHLVERAHQEAGHRNAGRPLDQRTQARRQHRPPHNRPRGQGQELTPSPAPAQNIRRSVRPLSPTFTLKKLPRTSLLSRIRGTLAFAAAPAGTRPGARNGSPVSSSANSSVSTLIASKRYEGKRQALKSKPPSQQRLEV